MKRLVGKAKPKAPPKSLEETSKAFDERVNKIDARGAVYDKDIRQIKLEMKKYPKNSPKYNALKKRALMKMKQRKMYENQGDTARNQQFNIDQQMFQMESMQATAEQLKTMAATKKQMKKQIKKINIDKVQDLKDDIDDMMDDFNDVQDILGENAGMEDIDEGELDAELDMIDDLDDVGEGVDDAVPDHLRDDLYASELPAAPTAVGGGHEAVAKDDFGLPVAPVPVPKQV